MRASPFSAAARAALAGAEAAGPVVALVGRELEQLRVELLQRGVEPRRRLVALPLLQPREQHARGVDGGEVEPVERRRRRRTALERGEQLREGAVVVPLLEEDARLPGER